MNARISKLLRKSFYERSDYRRFKFMYTRATPEQRAQIRTLARKIVQGGKAAKPFTPTKKRSE